MKYLFVFLLVGLVSCGDDNSSGNIINSKEIDKSQEKLNSVLELLKVRLNEENCRARPLIIQSPYAENQNQSVYGTLTFRGSNLELEYSEQYFKTYESFILERDSWILVKGKLSNVNISSEKRNGLISPVLNGEFKSATQTANFKVCPIFEGDNNGNIYYELGTSKWSVWGYNDLSPTQFDKLVGLMCSLANIAPPESSTFHFDNEVKNLGYFTINNHENIKDFFAYSGRGNVSFMTNSNNLFMYRNGTKIWEKKYNSDCLLYSSILNQEMDKAKTISILSDDKLSIVENKTGNVLKNINTRGQICFVQKGMNNELSFLIPNNNVLKISDEKGNLISNYSFSSDIMDMVLFKEKGEIHVAVLCNKHLFILDLEGKRVVRKITIDQSHSLQKFDESSVLINQNTSDLMDLNGEEVVIKLSKDYELKSAFTNNQGINFLFVKDSQIICINSKGETLWVNDLSCDSIDKIVIHNLDNKKINQIIIGVLDNSDKKITLLDYFGNLLDDVKRTGEKDLQIRNIGDHGFSVTTLLGGKLIQYVKYLNHG